MKLTQRQDGERTWVVVEGAVDASNAPQLRASLAGFESCDLTIDLSGVPFMDSSGLGVLVGAYKRARAAGGSVQLVDPTPTVLRVLQLTRLDKVLPILQGVEG